MADEKTFEDALEKQLELLKSASATTTNPCTVAKFIAISDPRVRSLMSEKNQEGHVFKGIHCEGYSVPEYTSVLFKYECKEGMICLVPPTFQVIVRVIGGFVVAIVDPYIPGEPRASGGDRTGGCGCSSPVRTAEPSECEAISSCITVTISEGKACLRVPYAGEVCVSVPDSVPNGTVAEACIDTCSKWGITCGAKVSIRVLGSEVASSSWGCC
jgi:hypothetical protein